MATLSIDRTVIEFPDGTNSRPVDVRFTKDVLVYRAIGRPCPECGRMVFRTNGDRGRPRIYDRVECGQRARDFRKKQRDD